MTNRKTFANGSTHQVHADAQGIPCIRGLEQVAHLTTDKLGLFGSIDIVGIHPRHHGNPAFGTGKFRDFEVIDIHTAFFVQKAVHRAQRGCRIVQVFLGHHVTQHHTALDEFNFGIGRACNFQKGTHLAHGLACLVTLDIDLQQSIACKLRTDPHANQNTNDCTKGKEKKQ